MYEIARADSEIRVNDYNPVLLNVLGANMDIQFVGDKDMAVSTYVSGYLTKCEKSHLQDHWDEIGNEKSLCSKLFKIGHMMLKSREMGMHEACDQLLGDHLYGKSETVQWVDVRAPHKRNRRVKDHAELVQMETVDPDNWTYPWTYPWAFVKRN